MTERRFFPNALRLGLAGGTLAGTLVAALTTKLNFHLDLGAVVGLYVIFCGIYGALGLMSSALAAGGLVLWAKVSGRGRGGITVLHRYCTAIPRRLFFVGWFLGLAGFFLFGLAPRTHSPIKPRPNLALQTTESEPAKDKEPSPLVLLCIDGVDLDEMILPMVEAGELPTFRRLLRRGTYGRLETILPTLSPIIWTTLVTGQPAAEHGITDFVHYRLPGVDGPIFHFPRHVGFTHNLFPLLTKIPGSGFLRAPFTGDLRRSRALWEIVGERYPVGVYQWLITQPVEEVNGFMVSGGLYAGPGEWPPIVRKWLRHTRKNSPETLRTNRLYPLDAWEGIPPVSKKRVGVNRLRPYLAPDQRQGSFDFKAPLFKLIASGLRDPTLDELVALSEKYSPRFIAANFYTVDAFQHRFGEAHSKGGLFSAAVAERYRFTDRQLGRYLATLEPRTNVIIISDHGFDFEVNHHFDAPPGIFLAVGPAFARQRQVEGLSVFDIAPLILHLLGFPLAEDMPGTLSGKYRDALRPIFLKRHPAETIPTYGSRQMGEVQGQELDEQVKKELESLGYL